MRSTLFMGLLYFIAKVPPLSLYLIKSLGRKKNSCHIKKSQFPEQNIESKGTENTIWTFSLRTSKASSNATQMTKNKNSWQRRKVEPLKKFSNLWGHSCKSTFLSSLTYKLSKLGTENKCVCVPLI